MKQFTPTICPKCLLLAPELIRFPSGKWECPRCAYPTYPAGSDEPRWRRKETMPHIYSDWYAIVEPGYDNAPCDDIPEWYHGQSKKA